MAEKIPENPDIEAQLFRSAAEKEIDAMIKQGFRYVRILSNGTLKGYRTSREMHPSELLSCYRIDERPEREVRQLALREREDCVVDLIKALLRRG